MRYITIFLMLLLMGCSPGESETPKMPNRKMSWENFEATDSSNHGLYRTKIPKGWIVVVDCYGGHFPITIEDPEHQWEPTAVE